MSKKDKKSKSSKKTKYSARTADKHELYEISVQYPEAEVRFLDRVFRREYGRPPVSLKEDFCGTSLLCAEWIKSRRDRQAIGVDLDREVLEWGLKRNIEPLGERAGQVTLLRKDVLEVLTPKVDIVVAFNFSFCIFKKRAELLDYCRRARRSLGREGLFVLDIFGGAQSITEMTDTRSQSGFTYQWEQASYDPINNNIVCHIHFKFPDKTKMKRAFTYDWRLWTIPELKEILLEAGFKRADAYWEGTEPGSEEGNGVFRKADTGTNDPAFVAYVVGVK